MQQIHTKYAYRCLICPRAAEDRFACCSKECRDSIPDCKVIGCGKATVPGVYGDQLGFSENCYKHGGRMQYNGEEIPSTRVKKVFVLTTVGWYEAVLRCE